MVSVLRVSGRRLRVFSDSQWRDSRAVHARDPLVVSAIHETNVDFQVFERLKYTRAYMSATRSEVTFVGRETQHRQTERYILKDCPLMSPVRDHKVIVNWMVSGRTGHHVLGFDEQHVETHLKDRHETRNVQIDDKRLSIHQCEITRSSGLSWEKDFEESPLLRKYSRPSWPVTYVIADDTPTYSMISWRFLKYQCRALSSRVCQTSHMCARPRVHTRTVSQFTSVAAYAHNSLTYECQRDDGEVWLYTYELCSEIRQQFRTQRMMSDHPSLHVMKNHPDHEIPQYVQTLTEPQPLIQS